MSGMRRKERNAATLPPGMPSIQARKKKTWTKERGTRKEIRGNHLKRKEDSGISAIHSGNRKIRRSIAGQSQQSSTESDKDMQRIEGKRAHTPHESAGHEEGADDENRTWRRSSSRDSGPKTRMRSNENA